MCLINLHLNDHPNYKLIVAANRDEFYERSTAPADFWEDEPQILAGRDLVQMGTWLGVTKQGRFAALTNFRDPDHMQASKFSRGEIVKDYLRTDISPEEFLHTLKQDKDKYVGYNVLVGNAEKLFHYNNVHDEITAISPGTHGLSNDTLNTPWPKVTKGKKNLRDYVMSQEEIEPDKLFEIVSDAEEAPDDDLPETGVELDFERKLSPLFIQTPDYGTRSSTVLLIDNQDNITFHERTFDQGEFKKENHFSFQIENI
ncbi:NRDE family protein [Virgibacillus sp. NKC19-16]|uniref:NRDE family protein n=1 Tax=Virgibacillus salidurans TaxID=2831673 RepID=UPI001F1CB408|nr:NRDE family protein [Virgibacillus sp. NKC19-16]UJL47387.1 NRDE family protein [Virgibacillus sp. NKC19-16]